MKVLVAEFGNCAEDVTPSIISSWLDEHDEWTLATKNRYIALLKLTYRLAEAQKIKYNPARRVQQAKENNERIRRLNQYEAAPTELDYLKDCKDEGSRIRAVIQQTARSAFLSSRLDCTPA